VTIILVLKQALKQEKKIYRFQNPFIANVNYDYTLSHFDDQTHYWIKRLSLQRSFTGSMTILRNVIK